MRIAITTFVHHRVFVKLLVSQVFSIQTCTSILYYLEKRATNDPWTPLEGTQAGT